MTPQLGTHATEAPPSIVLAFAASPLSPHKPLVWPWAVVAASVLGLLLGFYFVVREIEKQGEQRRVAVAARQDATWRCNALYGRLQRSNCLAQLNAPGDKALVVQVVARTDQR